MSPRTWPLPTLVLSRYSQWREGSLEKWPWTCCWNLIISACFIFHFPQFLDYCSWVIIWLFWWYLWSSKCSSKKWIEVCFCLIISLFKFILWQIQSPSFPAIPNTAFIAQFTDNSQEAEIQIWYVALHTFWTFMHFKFQNIRAFRSPPPRSSGQSFLECQLLRAWSPGPKAAPTFLSLVWYVAYCATPHSQGFVALGSFY